MPGGLASPRKGKMHKYSGQVENDGIKEGLLMCCVKLADKKTNISSAIATLKSSLAYFILPDFGLLGDLLGIGFLTPEHFADVRSERTVYDRNAALLDLMTTEDQCDKFLKSLQRTGQQRVVNFITQNGGQKHNDVLT